MNISPALSAASRVKVTTSGHATRGVARGSDYGLAGLHRVGYGSTATWYLNLPANRTSVTITFRVHPDKLTENNESAVVRLTSIDTANAPYKLGNPASTEIVILDNLVGPNPDSSGVSGALPWSATLTAQDLSRDRGSNPMVVRKKKDADGGHVACAGDSGLDSNESCVHGFVYERVALLDENGDSVISGRTDFPSAGCRNDHDHGSQCSPPMRSRTTASSTAGRRTGSPA